MRLEDIRYAVMRARRNGEEISHIELTEESIEEVKGGVVAESTEPTGIPGGAVDVKEGSTNQLVTERGNTYSI